MGGLNKQLGQGGSAIRAAVAALFCTLLLLVGATPAHAGPGLHLSESEARAGQVVHFSVSDVDEEEAYAIQIGDRTLAAGNGTESEQVSGQFTMPDFGGGERKVTVEAEIRDGDDRKTVKRKLRYLGGPAPPLTVADTPPPTPPAPAPAALPPAAPAPVPAQPLTAAGVPASERPAIRPRSRSAPPRHARKKSRSERRRSRSQADRPKRHGWDSAVKRAKRNKAKRNRARTAPLFDGVPEPGSGGSGGSSDAGSGLNDGNTIAPPAAALTGAGADIGGGGLSAAVLVPALLGLAALALTGTALLRRRRAP